GAGAMGAPMGTGMGGMPMPMGTGMGGAGGLPTPMPGAVGVMGAMGAMGAGGAMGAQGAQGGGPMNQGEPAGNSLDIRSFNTKLFLALADVKLSEEHDRTIIDPAKRALAQLAATARGQSMMVSF